MTFLRTFRFVPVLLAFVAAALAQSNVKNLNLAFTTIDVPGATLTSVNGINTAGDMVGWYANDSFGPYHSFLLKAGNFTFFDYPGAVSTEAMGINDSGLIVGFEGDFFSKGFLYDGTAFTTIRVARNSRTQPYGINNAGDVVGGAGTPYETLAFVMHGGAFKVVNFPGSHVYAYAAGINNVGQIVGWSTPDNAAYLYSKGRFSPIAFPGAVETVALSINDNGFIVGWYGVGGNEFGFVAKNGKFMSFSYPGFQTFAQGINSSGQIIGSYTNDFETVHGFVTSPITAEDLQFFSSTE